MVDLLLLITGAGAAYGARNVLIISLLKLLRQLAGLRFFLGESLRCFLLLLLLKLLLELLLLLFKPQLLIFRQFIVLLLLLLKLLLVLKL